MSDVLSAEEVKELANPTAGWPGGKAWYEANVVALARSHEQLQDLLDLARLELLDSQVGDGPIVGGRGPLWDRLQAAEAEVEQLRGERDEALGKWQEVEHPFDKSEFDAMYERMVAAEARLAAADQAVRAGEAAADALKEILSVWPLARPANQRSVYTIARQALTAYDRAVSGQTAEKEET